MKIAVLSGDGIGPEVMEESLKVLRKIGEIYGHSFEFNQAYVGGAAWAAAEEADEELCHLPDVTVDKCKESDAILFGSSAALWTSCKRQSGRTARRSRCLASAKSST
jgi:3-isopropylmalate dehydrogenase